MLLINPATEQFGGFLSRYIPLGLPIAIGTLAGYLEQFGHQVNVFDDEIEKEAIIEALTDVIRDAKGNDMDLVFEDLDDFDSYQETDFSSLADLEN